MWVKDHYGCDEITGMILENNLDSTNAATSHWEKSVLYNDLMTVTQP